MDLYVGGVEHAVLHLLYARFWHKVLFDLGHVSTREPFRRLVNQGYILADAFTDARGMYVPAAEVRAGGRRHVQLRRPAGAPPRREDGQEPEEQRDARTTSTSATARTRCGCTRWRWGRWTPTGPGTPTTSSACYRFLQRLWRTMVSEQTGDLTVGDGGPDDLDEATARLLHRTIARGG